MNRRDRGEPAKGRTDKRLSVRHTLLAIAIPLTLGVVPSAADAKNWTLSGPFTDESGISTCEALSEEGLGLRMRPDDTYLMAFFDLRASDHPFVDKILAAGELFGIVQAGAEYAFTTRLFVFDTKVTADEKLHLVGLSGSDFHLIDAMKRADYLYVIVTDDWAKRMFEFRTDDFDLRYSLKGSSKPIDEILDCAGY